MLTTAHELYKKSSQASSRLMYNIGALMAKEHLASEDVDSAQKLLESIAGECWESYLKDFQLAKRFSRVQNGAQESL